MVDEGFETTWRLLTRETGESSDTPGPTEEEEAKPVSPEAKVTGIILYLALFPSYLFLSCFSLFVFHEVAW